MIPILYSSTTTAFNNNGIGLLSSAIKCKTITELNGQHELEMQYPIDGEFYSSIQQRSIIYATTDRSNTPQPFRVYRITRPFNGIVTVYARHIAYDLMGVAVSPYTAADVGTALSGIRNNAANTCPFTFSTDKTTAASFKNEAPKSAWSIMGGTEGSILDTFGGEYEFDGFTVRLLNHRGADRGVSVRYGINMTDIQQDENCSNCYTGVYPYWADADGNVTELSEKIVNASGTFDYTKILPLDLSSNFEEAPTPTQLRSAANSYITSHNIGVPDVSLEVKFIDLAQTEEYKNIAALNQVYLGDTVSVTFEKLGVQASARVVSTVWDCMLDRYDTVTLGKAKASIANTIASQGDAIKATDEKLKTVPKVEVIQQIVNTLGDRITGANGGSVRFLDTNGDGEPDEFYIADNPDPNLAQKVWRFNYEGWAASKTGYAGPFVFGATLDDGMLADFITAANLTAGTIQSYDGKTFYLNLNEGVLRMDAQNISLNGNRLGDFIRVEQVDGKPALSIGWSGNSLMLRLLNDRISFYDMNVNPPVELAYWTNNSFRLKTLQSFQIGNMQMVAQSSGSVSFVKGEP